MYSRSYHAKAGEGMIPPDYRGNAFDLARERDGGGKSASAPRTSTPRGTECKAPFPASREDCACEAAPAQCMGSPRAGLLSGLFSRGSGRAFRGDDLLLGGLIILLLNSGADEELLLILAFLFISGF